MCSGKMAMVRNKKNNNMNKKNDVNIFFFINFIILLHKHNFNICDYENF